MATEMHGVCPYCLNEVDCHTDTDGDASPAAGDVSLCLYCANVSIYTESGAMVIPDLGLLVEILGDPRVIRARQEIKRLNLEARR